MGQTQNPHNITFANLVNATYVTDDDNFDVFDPQGNACPMRNTGGLMRFTNYLERILFTPRARRAAKC
jgi:hypothetical protein